MNEKAPPSSGGASRGNSSQTGHRSPRADDSTGSIDFTVAFLAGLVRDRFATVELNSAQVVWVEITDLGRELLARSVSGPPAAQSRHRALG